ncbi:chaperone required for assembly of F1-ATPase [Rhizobium subbaraonis]|uniref:Chaperone required for assembly of F1-ATPase n=1 Tax=Rhizobium subbaraonis TaxID=908946 RepID=A0A285UKR2_9HYPH|nr:ATP12 family protein [Rhizobium subbaraonis]SOC42504.1 chaperone required for assembly of F1-ATPase [Rhizobium subbaraonis]
MRDILSDLSNAMSDPDPVRRAQIQMKRPLPKRFYKDVVVALTDDGYAVQLDGRVVRTPAKRALAVETAALAEYLKNEWDAQAEEVDAAKMPVTRLVNTALDGVADNRDAVIEEMVRFAGTDMICYRADGPERLVEIQRLSWDPVLAWAADTFGARFILAEGVIHQEQPAPAIAAFAAALARFTSPLEIACIHTVTTLTGSALLALAFAYGRLDAETAWKLAHVDEDWQIEHWGTDEEAFRRREARWQEMQVAATVFEALKAR